MKIKEIELNGFKSFSDRTVLALHDGVTVIVGPNGCGKSNIVDAFRWVLGEQSAKSLRGEKMEEVIFQGSAARKPKGMAEVTLSISLGLSKPKTNGNGADDQAVQDKTTDSVVVSRRLYRSGESDYLINKRSCRLKDIRDIFLDTGLDVKSYSILDQGRIGEILNAKPADRRFLIEEVAGVMKYKVRKAEALSKLESSKENLQRINDIIHEVRRQLNSLDRQVKKAERYKRLIEELKTIELRIARREFLHLSEMLATVLAEVDVLHEADAAKRGELAAAENQLESERIGIVEKEKELAALEQKLYEKERTVSDTEKRIAVLKTTLENLQYDRARLEAIQSDSVVRKEELSRKCEELDLQAKSHRGHIDSLQEMLQEKREATAAIEASIAEQESLLEEHRKALFSASDRLSARRNEQSKLLSSSETLAYKESVAQRDAEGIEQSIASADAGIAEADEKIAVQNAMIAELKAAAAQLNDEADALRQQIDDRKADLARQRELLAAHASRLASLKDMIVDKTLRDFLADSSNRLHVSGTVLSDILSADKEYEVAIEAALSEKINALILDNADDVVSAVDVVRQKQLGRTAIFYTGMGVQNEAIASEQHALSSHQAILGKASDFIRTEHLTAEHAVSHVLDNVYVTQDVRSAMEVVRSYPSALYTLVTLDGVVISSNGFITAGQGQDILKRKREIKELQKTIDLQHETIASIEQELVAAQEELNIRLSSVRETEAAIVEAEKEVSLLQHQRAAFIEDRQRKERRLSSLAAERSALTAEKESLKAALAKKSEEIHQLEVETQTVRVTMAALQETIAGIKESYEQERSQIEDLRLEIAAYREKLIAVEREKEAAERSLEEIDEKFAQAAQESESTEQKIARSREQLQQLEESIKTTAQEAGLLRQRREQMRDTIAAEKEALLTKEHGLKSLRTEIDELSQRLSDRRSVSVEQKMKLESLQSAMSQKYGVAIGEIEIDLAEFDAEADVETVNTLNEKIRELGPVNLGTLEEYEELKTRYEFLTKQQQDLTMSIAELEEAISRINQTTRRKLREAYDALRAKFVEVFTTLFGGGRADLILTDEDNILEAGLEIIAQPPGKKLQNINLLSGGEKALTSLALLFAGFLLKPSPLCILDEADAPLDESNTFRFAQMIRDLAKETQFVVITHNRTTMEAADYLYGITMEEAGASKAISLQLSEVESIGVS